MRTLYLTMLFSVVVTRLFAQIDTEFWFAPPEVSKGHGDRPVMIRVSSQDEPANVRISQPARGDAELASFSLPANTTQTVELTAFLDEYLETRYADSVMRTGLHIVSTAPITAYYEEASFFNAEIFVLKGRNAMGRRFIIPSQMIYDNATDYSPAPSASFDIVATEDFTLVTIVPTRPLIGHENESVITIRLNKGETYSFRKPGALASMNPIGTVVTSTKPVAITIKDDSVAKLPGGCRDLLGDQLIPAKVAGKEYIVPRGFLDRPEFIFIVATEDNTDVFVSGLNVPIAHLNTGEWHQVEVSIEAVYVRATRNVLVLHVTGFGCEVGMTVLPPVNCTGSKNIAFTRSTNEFFGMIILVRKAGIFSFKLKGNGKDIIIPPSIFREVPGTQDEWYTAQISYPTDDIPVGQASVISNVNFSFQAGIINGNAATTCRYGYFSSYSTLFIGDDFSLCQGESAVLNAGSGKESYSWNTGEQTQSIVVNATGDYWVTVVREDCTLSDTLHVDVVTGEEDLGPDLELCEGETIRIDGKQNFSWIWSDGTIGRYLETADIGKYWVTVSDKNGCTASDTLNVVKYISSFDQRTGLVLNRVSVDTTFVKTIHADWTVIQGELLPGNIASLFRRMPGEDEWKFIGAFRDTIQSYPDNGLATADSVYEYYVSLSDKCGKEYLSTAIHNSMVLTGTVDSITDILSFQWNHYQEWPDGVERYELWRKLDEHLHYRFVAEIPFTQTSFTGPLATDGFSHQYAIRAVERSGLNDSWSNPVAFTLKHRITVPNVFTPNGDRYNEFFEIPKIQLYTRCRLVVVDRWGKTVYESRNYQNDWDGRGLSSGVYYYLLDLGSNGEIFKGVVSVLRGD